MAKKIEDVFKGINLSNELHQYFQNSEIEKIYIVRNSSDLIIELKLTMIVFPEFIEQLAEAINVYLHTNQELNSLNVKIHEHFHLEHHLALPDLYKFYNKAICSIVKKVSPVCGIKIPHLQPAIENNKIIYPLDEQLYKYYMKYNICSVIEDIFMKKFHMEVQVEVDKIEGKHLVEKFIESREKEEKKLLQKMDNEQSLVAHEMTKVKEIKKEDTTPENLLIGKKSIVGQVSYIGNFSEETKDVILEVFLLNLEVRDLKSGKKLIIFDATDFTGSITCKCFLRPEQYERANGNLKKGMFARILGKLQYDDFQKENTIMVGALEKIDDFRNAREDQAKEKRVELHLHTQMSDMDAVVSAKDVVKKAVSWGHKAIAITDHGVVQAFPEAFHAAHGSDIKVIYGVEAYLVDDEKPTIYHAKQQSFFDTYVIFDIETTGFYPGKDKITEIGAVKIKNGEITERFSHFVNPERGIPIKVQELTGITPEMVQDQPIIEKILPMFLEFIDDAVLVAHNADFDLGFIRYFCAKQGLNFDYTSIDTLGLARVLIPDLTNYKLNTLAKALKVPLSGHHRAVNDAEATANLFLKFIEKLEDLNIKTLQDYIQYENEHPKNPKKLRPNHAIMLAKNLIGLKNLYQLISMSHIEFFFKQPRIPKSVFRKYREGILLGTACEAGELFKAILEQKDQEEVTRIASFYDFFEIQPIGNNEFMLRDGIVESEEELRNVNKKIIELGKSMNKKVVATCDVHFMNPEDEVYRRILMAGKGFKDADQQAPLYFRTTDEMLQEFSYLGEEIAYETVVTNTNAIADQIEKIDPVPPEKYPPEIPGSDEELRAICYEKAKSLYGEPLPEIVEERLERELDSIIGNGFAVMYIIAQKLVWKSNEDGYLVGSRGSVGSSFAATMAGITEVNPLPPHYLCHNCKYVDFNSESVKAHAGNSGCDLEDKECPNCGNLLAKEGHDIPFETFLGFKGDKEPDIDLNFSGEYQSKAHEYTEVLFGKGHVFRAGTIGTLAEKTAFGFVKKYFDEKEEEVNKAEINRLVLGCTGVRRTSGQHPGGIIVVPKDQDIYKFTPVQRPANDMESTTVTTHFDYHSIDHNLLKLDILGHDDPTIIKMLEDMTGADAKTIPLDEPKVMSLFKNTSALGVEPEDIGGCSLGCLGVPEFGTDFVIQMLLDTRPSCFSDLVRISGLSHGTDVWLNNAQLLVKEGKATISTVISTRDDIMTYLINQGVEKGLAFTIMESVRKGKGLKDEWVEEMKNNNVPEWYIWSCKQIKYMFPKAHAVAYVMMAYRIAYFKVYYPLAYYTAFFSIRAANFDYEIMCRGKEHLEEHMRDFKKRFDELSKKEKDMIKDMRIVQEMYARGFDFMPIDLYKVDANRFQIIDHKIMPSLSAIQGLGEKAAENIVASRDQGEFLSIEDLRNRTKVTKTVIEVMKKNHILDGLPETNQLSLF